MELTKESWDNRYIEGTTGWDVGEISLPIKFYIDQLVDKKTTILIPGAGNSYEAEYLHHKGFENVIVLDISSEAIANFRNRVPDFPPQHVINQNFFNLTGSFDVMVEQTFFCAIDKKLRPAYAKQAASLLGPRGRLVGLLFDDPLYEDHPPFGGSKEEYRTYFEPYFHIDVMETANNSIKPRAGRELWIKMVKK